MKLSSTCSLLSQSIAVASAQKPCPLLGQQYPPPTDISSEPKFQAAAKTLEASLNQRRNNGTFTNLSFSLSMFSTSEEDLVWDYHQTSAGIANSSQGAREVNADSIYRIGSISKLLTMYLWLITDGDRRWNHPITDYIPELLEVSTSDNGVTPDWESITIGDLAGQMAGLNRNFGLADLGQPDNGLVQLPKALAAAFSTLPEEQVPICAYLASNGTYVVCSDEEYLTGVASTSPIFPTGYTPVYSNDAFGLLGVALATIRDDTLENLFDTNLVEQLGLSGTHYSVPETYDNALIPGDPTAAGWDSEFGPFAGAGGFYSTTNDLAIMGKAMLSSELITKAETQRWMKPSGFVQSMEQGVGRPWEIIRATVNGQTVDLYTKGGDWGQWHTWFILVPTYDFGFTVLTADDIGAAGSGEFRPGALNEIIASILPILDEIAKDQAEANFAGLYTATDTNSSLVITSDNNSALKVDQWISNDVDVLTLFSAQVPNLDFRILPNLLLEGKKVGFTSFYQSPVSAAPNEVALSDCLGWLGVDSLNFGNIPLGQMTFEVDDSGRATGVNLRSLRATLQKQS